MKKILSCTVATAIASTPLTTFATSVTDTTANENTAVNITDEKKITGSLELDINFPTPIINSDKNDITVDLKNSSGSLGKVTLNGQVTGSLDNGATFRIEKLNSKREVVSSEDKNIYFIRVIFENLERGNYSVELSGNGYSTANINDIDITEYSKRIKVGTAENIITTKDSAGNEIQEVYKGSFLAGNVDSQSIINMDDYNLVLNETFSKKGSSNYDINKDGKVDVSDLTNIKKNLGKSNVVLNKGDYENTNAIIDPEKVSITTNENTTITGNIKNILTDSTESVLIGNEQAPSAQNPISIKLDLSGIGSADSSGAVEMEKIVIKAPVNTSEDAGAPEAGVVRYTDINGNVVEKSFDNSKTRSSNEDIVIDLGTQVAVKEITIDVTANRGNKNISQIAKIEFLNNVYKEIPKPQMNIPQIRTVETCTDLHDERITLTWDPQENVTGYEVKYQKLDENNNVQWTKTLTTNKCELNILDKAIRPYDLFRVSIQSLNGEWESGYDEEGTGYWNGSSPLDGKADNVDENYNIVSDYYGTQVEGTSGENVKYHPKDKGTVSEIRVVPKGKPTEPINLTIRPGYKSFTVSWENHIRARDFDIYYRKVDETENIWKKANDNNIEVVENSEEMTNPDKSKLSRSHTYTVNGLEDQTTYEVRVTATNHLGTSPMSESYLATTQSVIPPESTNYKLINTLNDTNEVGTSHIIDVQTQSDSITTTDGKFAVVDGDYTTDFIRKDWDTGIYGDSGPIITFDKEYTIGEIALFKTLQQGSQYDVPYKVEVHAFDEAGNQKTYQAKIQTKSSNNQSYALLTFEEPIKAKKIQVNPSVYGGRHVSISEIKFYEYDSLQDDVKALFKDDLMLELKEDVTQDDLDALIERAKTMDPVSKEYHPNLRNILGKDTETDEGYKELGQKTQLGIAQRLLDETNISQKITKLDGTITTRNGGQRLGMSNDWQSLGSVARPGIDENNQAKEITVYLGSSDPNTKVDIVFLQSYGQPDEYISKVTTITPGSTSIVIPEIFNANVEKGGVVMARVTSGSQNADIQIRLSGVDEIPHLNVNNLINDETKQEEVKTIVRDYIRELKQYVNDLPSKYPLSASGTDNANNIYTYDPNTSALDSTDIEGDRFTLTFPASQILAGIEEGMVGDEDAQVDRLYKALLAWEQEMQFAYAKKGVYEKLEDFNGSGEIDDEDKAEFNKNKVSTIRMNIKYQRMVMGAAGYASSHHVGVTSGKDLVQGIPYEFDEEGKVTNADTARLYGDLIGHEIGHVMDISDRLYPETSNNLMRELMKTIDDKDKSSIEGDGYKALYKKVTSQTIGLSTDRTVVLGMLWQLRLAYEDNYTSQMLINDNDNNPNNDSYFAKLNRGYRNKLEGEQSSDRDQTLIRIASRIVEKDLTDFFIAHGIIPDAETYSYIAKNGWPKEERNIQYINDEARRQRLANTATMAEDTKVVANFGVDKEGNQIKDRSYVNQNEVPITLSVDKDSDKILGYEILRNGVPCAFVEANGQQTIEYKDVIDILNNRTFEYSVVAYDYALNQTVKVDLGTIKVRHDGSISQKSLKLSTNTIDKNSDFDPHGETNAINTAIDGNTNTVYEGRLLTKDEYNSLDHKDESLNPNKDPYVIIDTNSVNAIAGIKYTAPTTTTKLFKTTKLAKSAIDAYEIQVSKDGETWTTVKTGNFDLTSGNPTNTIYFDKDAEGGGKQLATHNARFVKLIAKGAKDISVAELNVIAPPGDNIEIGVSDDNINYKNGLGILKEDYIYVTDDPATDEDETKVIPKGSIVITGEYRGNPAFNVPLVLNQNEEHIADVYKGILLAEIPNSGDLGEISEGNWIYWVTPEHQATFMQDNQEIFAELYRTDTADASDGGQRLVSNTFKIDVPDVLPEISLSQGKARKSSTKSIEINKDVLNKIKKSR